MKLINYINDLRWRQTNIAALKKKSKAADEKGKKRDTFVLTTYAFT